MAADTPSEQILPFSVIQPKLNTALEACALKLNREWPADLKDLGGMQGYVEGVVRWARNTYDTIRYFCADIPPDSTRRPEFAYSAPPLSRTILDGVFTLSFMFEDKRARWSQFEKSGWREAHEDLERHGAAYGSDPDWTEWLNGMAATNEGLRRLAKVTPSEIANPKLIPWWPNPGKMPKMMSDPARQVFLQRLNDWFYKELSGKGHLSLIGFASGPAHLLLPEGTDMDLVHKYRSNSVFNARPSATTGRMRPKPSRAAGEAR
jgi:hypothetical protein